MIKKNIEETISYLQENKDVIDSIFCITISNNDRIQSRTNITSEQLRNILYTIACDDIRIGGAILQTAIKLANDIKQKKDEQ